MNWKIDLNKTRPPLTMEDIRKAIEHISNDFGVKPECRISLFKICGVEQSGSSDAS